MKKGEPKRRGKTSSASSFVGRALGEKKGNFWGGGTGKKAPATLKMKEGGWHHPIKRWKYEGFKRNGAVKRSARPKKKERKEEKEECPAFR